MDKKRLNSIRDYACENFPFINENGSSYSCEVTYDKQDLLNVYKINKMLLLNIIDEKEYYRLMTLYYEYIDLCNKYENFMFLATHDLLEKSEYTMQSGSDILIQIELIENELEKYELISNYEPSFTEIYDNYITNLVLKYKKIVNYLTIFYLLILYIFLLRNIYLYYS